VITDSIDAEVQLETLQHNLPMKQIYEGIVFD
jgi:hypothetical protein